MNIVLATRGSELALWQANTTRDLLLAVHPDFEVTLETIRSFGDADQKSALARFGRIGIFTAEVDAAVIAGRAHAGVHSLKDMTTTLHDGVVLAGVLARGPVEDVIVSRDGRGLDDLATGARVATGSMRRAAMLRRLRPDLEIVGIRGNVATRLRKLDEGEADALVMARAGLVRLGLDEHVTEVIGVERLLPAVGQGIVGLTCRADDETTLRRLRAISDREAWIEAACERAFLRELHGGCNVPAGGHARVVENAVWMRARVLSIDGSQEIAEDARGLADGAEALGAALAKRLLERGAGDLIRAARNT